MIVMKFGGSSLESPDAIRRICDIVGSRSEQHPVVIVSAIGKSTNQLLSLAEQASRGHGYSARKTLSEIEDTHLRIASELVHGKKLEALERSLQDAVRELQGLIHDLSENGKMLTRALSDYVASFGERLSSKVVASALLQFRVPAIHLDAREFILTDDRHGSATPLLWETYARLRRTIPQIAQEVVVVMGGFIGSTESGATTTLGRGGSDLTASLVAAGTSAEEIQIWTDVDGMLTCDPRVLKTVYRVRSLSYDEAATLAGAGAQVLHPDTIEPALRHRIPVTIRNSRVPHQEGTRISTSSKCPVSGVKAIALKENLTVFSTVSKVYPCGSELRNAIEELCFRSGVKPVFLCETRDIVLLGLPSHTSVDKSKLELDGSVEVHLWPTAALITLVGSSLPASRNTVALRVRAALKNVYFEFLHNENDSLCLQIVVPQLGCRDCCERLHREFFAAADSELFSAVALRPANQHELVDAAVAVARRKVALLARCAF